MNDTFALLSGNTMKAVCPVYSHEEFESFLHRTYRRRGWLVREGVRILDGHFHPDSIHTRFMLLWFPPRSDPNTSEVLYLLIHSPLTKGEAIAFPNNSCC